MNNVLNRTSLIVSVAVRSTALDLRGADGHPVRMNSLGFRDPDGGVVEFNQRLAG
jgi:hypothetical protein